MPAPNAKSHVLSLRASLASGDAFNALLNALAGRMMTPPLSPSPANEKPQHPLSVHSSIAIVMETPNSNPATDFKSTTKAAKPWRLRIRMFAVF
jgi:hypothetical protein